MSEVQELKDLIDEAAAKCHEASYKARDLGQGDIEQEMSEKAVELEQIYGQVEEGQ